MSVGADDVVRLRPATDDDLELLTVFMRQLREDDPEEGAFDETRCVPAMRRLIVDPKLGRVWLIEVAAQPAGYAVLTLGYSIEFGGVAAFVDELFVAREFRGRGVGTRALELMVAEAGNLDVAILLLEVTHSNDRAKRLYRKAGFADRGHHLMTRRPG
jgi:ribosomal protein S18 acetylase RimI-like enzyme